ncbi:hypothetical protein TNCT_241661 [Trichonephila clavata]|uniref:Uncharacterized protein n=1 Tax=Trichonephila clavata TaxID=2740835 RepID=A0A8X6IHY1_TRICU|nr:hypothetical protein TNCT_241661 [Trichonephila clavata]
MQHLVQIGKDLVPLEHIKDLRWSSLSGLLLSAIENTKISIVRKLDGFYTLDFQESYENFVNSLNQKCYRVRELFENTHNLSTLLALWCMRTSDINPIGKERAVHFLQGLRELSDSVSAFTEVVEAPRGSPHVFVLRGEQLRTK